ncbi:MAG: hypothetical protein PHI06_12985 [Desulfobulbaceae bacterium]|nr:hypothetical protein [Desulfobulbaceae bacterium]
MGKSLLGEWKLIDNRSDDGATLCHVCGAGLAKVGTVDPFAARGDAFVLRVT